MKWITRERVKVDRVACPWLIKKFVDSEAEFLFVPVDRVNEVAKRENAIPFDSLDVELTHYQENGIEHVSFDAIIKKYNLKDPAFTIYQVRGDKWAVVDVLGGTAKVAKQ